MTTYKQYYKVNLKESKKLLKAVKHFHEEICNLNFFLDYAGDCGSIIESLERRIKVSEEWLLKNKNN